MRIVIIEDEIRIREGVAKLIRKINPEYLVIGEAEDGLAGIRLVTETRPDLVITDIRMNGIDGLEMLYQLRENGVPVKAIVLSAYSEFNYAQQAIRLGVSEYLLKPVAVGDLSRSLKNIEAQLVAERLSAHPEHLRSLENILYSLLHGGVQMDGNVERFLQDDYGIRSDGTFALLPLYFGRREGPQKPEDSQKTEDPQSPEEPRWGSALPLLRSLLGTRTDCESRILEFPQGGELVVFLYNMDRPVDVERWARESVIPGMRKEGAGDFCAGWVLFERLSSMKDSLQWLRGLLDWSIVLGERTLITPDVVFGAQAEPFSYPIMIENKIRSALCASDGESFTAMIDQFLRCLRSGRLYSPRDLKESLVRFFWAVLNTAREVEYELYVTLPQQEILEQIGSAVTWGELESSAKRLLRLLPAKTGKNDSERLIVSRAINMIHEFHSQGITLDEIASRIGVTPEYLGTVFHRDTGVNFSAYIKNYRIQKAKELLIGTEMKLYAVGEKVGYADPKYFSRVFREVTGKMPSDYRKENK